MRAWEPLLELLACTTSFVEYLARAFDFSNLTFFTSGPHFRDQVILLELEMPTYCPGTIVTSMKRFFLRVYHCSCLVPSLFCVGFGFSGEKLLVM